MSQAFDVLKAALESKGTVSEEEITAVVKEHGEMTAEEIAWLQAELHERKRSQEVTVTMEQYLEAMKVLDTAPEGSPEYVEAEKIVNKFESAS